MDKHVAAQRVEALCDELRSSNVSAARVKEISKELDRIDTQVRNYTKATSMGSYASPEEFGMADTNPGSTDNGIWFKGIGPGIENQTRPVSMFSIDKTQIKALQQAAQQGHSFRVKLGSKGIEHGFMDGMRSKAAITEGGMTPNLLPPIQQLGDRGWFGIPLEIVRAANYLPNVAFNGPGIAYFSHTTDANPPTYVAEGGTKPDLTPTVTENYIRPSKVAGRVNITHELLQDAGDEFSAHLVTDLAREIYVAESNLILNGTTAANGFNGINQTSGVLTTAVGTDTPLDALNKSFVALRNQFFEPDLVFVHPSTLGALRRTKDTQNRYLLDMLTGVRGIDQTNNVENLWGVTTVSYHPASRRYGRGPVGAIRRRRGVRQRSADNLL